jgi:tRNA threonylcarbamoyladenosine biosynthesis protein TsaB
MRILAIELSTRRGSAALSSDGQLLADEAWEDGHQRLFEVLPSVLTRAGAVARDIDVLAAGRGPGVFSGIRVAITAAQALALPAGKAVYAVSSGEALAHRILLESQATRVAVVGDARRGTVWYGLFERAGQVSPWGLTTAESLDEALPPDAVRVSPDWDRLSPRLRGAAGWLTANRYPEARDVAGIVYDRLKRGVASEPVEPLYMHPPV